MHALPEVLVERLRNRQAVLVAGAGCSELAQLPGWAALGQCFLEWVMAEEDKVALADLLQNGRMTSALALRPLSATAVLRPKSTRYAT